MGNLLMAKRVWKAKDQNMSGATLNIVKLGLEILGCFYSDTSMSGPTLYFLSVFHLQLAREDYKILAKKDSTKVIWRVQFAPPILRKQSTITQRIPVKVKR